MSWLQRSAPLKWMLANEPDRTLVADLVATTKLPTNVIKILVNRQLDSPELIDRFLNPKMSDLRDPFTMVGMDGGIDRVIRALFENEKVMIYGDYDVDGITATALLYMVLNKLGSQVDYYLPNRLVEGYGLSTEGIDEAKKKGVTLIVTVDTGITAVEEVEYATSLGIDVVVTDHHEPGMSIPKAHSIINPKQPGCDYGGELSGVGVAFKFAQALYRRLEKDERELDEHLDLVALGTSADIVPLVGENRVSDQIRHSSDCAHHQARPEVAGVCLGADGERNRHRAGGVHSGPAYQRAWTIGRCPPGDPAAVDA